MTDVQRSAPIKCVTKRQADKLAINFALSRADSMRNVCSHQSFHSGAHCRVVVSCEIFHETLHFPQSLHVVYILQSQICAWDISTLLCTLPHPCPVCGQFLSKSPCTLSVTCHRGVDTFSPFLTSLFSKLAQCGCKSFFEFELCMQGPLRSLFHARSAQICLGLLYTKCSRGWSPEAVEGGWWVKHSL